MNLYCSKCRTGKKHFVGEIYGVCSKCGNHNGLTLKFLTRKHETKRTSK